MVSVAQMKHVTAVDVMVESLLYQVLGFVPCQLSHPAKHAVRSNTVERVKQKVLIQ